MFEVELSKTQDFQCFPRRQEVWGSLPFIAWWLNMNPRGHMISPNEFLETQLLHIFRMIYEHFIIITRTDVSRVFCIKIVWRALKWCFRWWPHAGGWGALSVSLVAWASMCGIVRLWGTATPNYQNCALKCLKQGTPLMSCVCLGHMNTVVVVPRIIILRALLVMRTFVGPRGLSLLSHTGRCLTKVGSINLLCVAVDHGEIPHQRLTWRTHEYLLPLKVEGVGGRRHTYCMQFSLAWGLSNLWSTHWIKVGSWHFDIKKQTHSYACVTYNWWWP